MLDVCDAVVRFGAVAAVDGVTLSVAKGEVLAVLGPSGCGKSTLLRAVAGLQPLARGRVGVEGVDQSGVPPHRRRVGLMFQDSALFPHRDVAGNVGFGLRMQGLAAGTVAERVTELLDLVGLPGSGRRTVGTLSGGEAQRVALARALAPEPRLLLLDEPFASLDRVLRDRLVEEVGALVRRLGLTVVAVTHDQAEAFALADRVAVMRAGHVVQTGPPAQLWAAPASSFVARFLGFRNVAACAVTDATAHTPWGRLPVARNATGRAVLVRPGGVELDPLGPIEAVVVGATFAGELVRLLTSPLGAPPLELDAPVRDAPAVGDAVRLRIDRGHVVVLPE